jgi:hypothetical protein
MNGYAKIAVLPLGNLLSIGVMIAHTLIFTSNLAKNIRKRSAYYGTSLPDYLDGTHFSDMQIRY